MLRLQSRPFRINGSSHFVREPVTIAFRASSRLLVRVFRKLIFHYELPLRSRRVRKFDRYLNVFGVLRVDSAVEVFWFCMVLIQQGEYTSPQEWRRETDVLWRLSTGLRSFLVRFYVEFLVKTVTLPCTSFGWHIYQTVDCLLSPWFSKWAYVWVLRFCELPLCKSHASLAGIPY